MVDRLALILALHANMIPIQQITHPGKDGVNNQDAISCRMLENQCVISISPLQMWPQENVCGF